MTRRARRVGAQSATRAFTVALALTLVGSGSAWGVEIARSGTPVTVTAAACNADARTVETAVAAYDANPPTKCTTNDSCTIGFEKLTGPGAIKLGTPRSYWQATQARRLLSAGDLNRWPTNSHFAISLAIHDYPKRSQAGEVLLYIPASSKHPTIYDDETSNSGCNALG